MKWKNVEFGQVVREGKRKHAKAKIQVYDAQTDLALRRLVENAYEEGASLGYRNGFRDGVRIGKEQGREESP